MIFEQRLAELHQPLNAVDPFETGHGRYPVPFRLDAVEDRPRQVLEDRRPDAEEDEQDENRQNQRGAFQNDMRNQGDGVVAVSRRQASGCSKMSFSASAMFAAPSERKKTTKM